MRFIFSVWLTVCPYKKVPNHSETTDLFRFILFSVPGIKYFSDLMIRALHLKSTFLDSQPLKVLYSTCQINKHWWQRLPIQVPSAHQTLTPPGSAPIWLLPPALHEHEQKPVWWPVSSDWCQRSAGLSICGEWQLHKVYLCSGSRTAEMTSWAAQRWLAFAKQRRANLFFKSRFMYTSLHGYFAPPVKNSLHLQPFASVQWHCKNLLVWIFGFALNAE